MPDFFKRHLHLILACLAILTLAAGCGFLTPETATTQPTTQPSKNQRIVDEIHTGVSIGAGVAGAVATAAPPGTGVKEIALAVAMILQSISSLDLWTRVRKSSPIQPQAPPAAGS